MAKILKEFIETTSNNRKNIRLHSQKTLTEEKVEQSSDMDKQSLSQQPQIKKSRNGEPNLIQWRYSKNFVKLEKDLRSQKSSKIGNIFFHKK